MIRTTDIFLVRAGMRGNLVGARRRASKSGSREGLGGSREWRGGRVSYEKITTEFVSSSG